MNWKVGKAENIRLINGVHELQLLTYDSCKQIVEDAIAKPGTDDNEKRTLENLIYPEEYFAENSLLLFYTIGEPFEIKSVQYESGVLTCAVRYTGQPIDSLSIQPIYPWAVFIELDTVLPEGTQIRFVPQTMGTYEYEDFAQAREAFYQQYGKKT